MKTGFSILKLGARPLFCMLIAALIFSVWLDERRGQTAQGAEDICINGPENLNGCPTPTPTPDSTSSPTPTPTSITESSPTPTPTPITDACDYFRGDIVRLGFSETKLQSYDKIFKRTGDAVGLGCLQTMINDAIRKCNSSAPTKRSNGIKHHDDCLAWEFVGWTMPDWDHKKSVLGTQSNGAVCDKRHNADMRYCPSGSPWGFGIAKGCVPCESGHFYFVEDPSNPNRCKVVREDPNLTLCGTFSLNYYESTPISLVWSESEQGLPLSFSQFPLDPTQPDLWHVWKASEELPLLVYDPSHQGKITSAQQLFGKWTFGGQPFASMATKQEGPTPWGNGYEALATLDQNGNGQIESQELQALGLWFDINRNGIADPGEVISLNQAGVTQLSYGPVESDGKGNLIVKAGYERVVNGKATSGRSIDWVTTSAPSQFDLLNEYFAPVTKDAAQENHTEPSPQEDKVQPTVAKESLQNYVGGVWSWAAAGENTQTARGYFILRDESDEVVGYSVMETPFRKPDSKQLYSYGTMFLLSGKKSKDKEGRVHLNFRVFGGNPEIVSEATFSPDLKTMEGQSTIQRKEASKSKTLNYRWVAKRYS